MLNKCLLNFSKATERVIQIGWNKSQMKGPVNRIKSKQRKETVSVMGGDSDCAWADIKLQAKKRKRKQIKDSSSHHKREVELGKLWLPAF